MRLLLVLIIALAASAGIALLVKDDPGYVLITVGQWTVETTVAVLVIVLLVAFVVLYKLLRYSVALVKVPQSTAKALKRRRTYSSDRYLAHGTTQLIEGRWQQAERSFARSAKDSPEPILGHLGAARAAHALGDTKKRDYYLRTAGADQADGNVAVGLTQAELLLDEGNTEAALARLTRLRNHMPKHAQVLALLARAYGERKDWEGLWQLLPDLDRRKAIPESDYSDLERTVYRELLALKTKSESLKELRNVWKSVPQHLRHDPDLVADYAGYLETHDAGDEAEQVIRRALDKQWDQKLVLAYGELSRCNPDTQLKFAESWVHGHKDESQLLLTLGRLARRKHHWTKAREYYEASLSKAPNAEAYQELGSLFEELEEPLKARDSYRAGMRLLTGRDHGGTTTVIDVEKEAVLTKIEPVEAQQTPAPTAAKGAAA
jgi:HemY protein